MAKSSKPRRDRSRTRTFPFDAAEVLDTPEAIAEYLTAALETNDPSYIAKAIGTVARARGMSDIARKVRTVTREPLPLTQRRDQD